VPFVTPWCSLWFHSSTSVARCSGSTPALIRALGIHAFKPGDSFDFGRPAGVRRQPFGGKQLSRVVLNALRPFRRRMARRSPEQARAITTGHPTGSSVNSAPVKPLLTHETGRGQWARADFVTFMQQRPRKGGSKAISRQIAVETRRARGMVSRVNGRVPVADGFQGRLLKGRPRRSETIGKRGLTTIGFRVASAGRRIEK
jgi:hypothetical protein